MDQLFSTTKVNEEGLKRMGRIRQAFDACLSSVVEAAGDGADARQISLTKTNLETACLHAIKAVSLNPNYQLQVAGA